jgi:predicted metal-binding protein
MNKLATQDHTSAVSPSWDALLLICKDCRRRKDGPKHKARELAKDIRHQVKSASPRVRVVLTTCLKLCPRKATSVAFVAVRTEPRIAAIKSSAQLQNSLTRLLDQD